MLFFQFLWILHILTILFNLLFPFILSFTEILSRHLFLLLFSSFSWHLIIIFFAFQFLLMPYLETLLFIFPFLVHLFNQSFWLFGLMFILYFLFQLLLFQIPFLFLLLLIKMWLLLYQIRFLKLLIKLRLIWCFLNLQWRRWMHHWRCHQIPQILILFFPLLQIIKHQLIFQYHPIRFLRSNRFQLLY